MRERKGSKRWGREDGGGEEEVREGRERGEGGDCVISITVHD